MKVMDARGKPAHDDVVSIGAPRFELEDWARLFYQRHCRA